MSFAESLFDWFVSATVRGTLLTGAVLLVQSALRPWLPAFWRHALWLPVVLVLAAPVLPESSWSLEERIDASFAFERAPAATSSPLSPAGSTDDSGSGDSRILGGGLGAKEVAAWIWLSGAVLVLITGFTAYARSCRGLARKSVPSTRELQEEVARAARVCGVRRLPRVLLCRSLSSPAVTGLIRPTLLLPNGFAKVFDEQERQLVLLHELIHLRRGDLAMNTVLLLLQALHWCNPVVWIAFARVRIDRETACDSAVLTATAERRDARKVYGHALLKLSRGPVQPGWTLACVGVFGKGAGLRSRVRWIAAHRREHRLWTLPGLALIAGLALAGGTRAQSRAAAELVPGTADTTNEIAIEAQFIEFPMGTELEILAHQIEAEEAKGQFKALQSPEDAAKLLEKLRSTPGVDLLSTPRVVTLSGRRAMIRIGQEVELEPGKPRKATGVYLSVLPTTKGREIELDVEATVAKMVDPATGQAIGELPKDKKVNFVENRVDTKVAVRPGQTLLLGGLAAENGEQPGRRLLVTLKPKALGGFEKKLREIVLSRVNFQEAKLTEALEFFRQQSRELNPDRAGIQIILTPAAEATTVTITLSLANIPLSDALRYTAELAGVAMRVEETAVVFDVAPKPGAQGTSVRP